MPTVSDAVPGCAYSDSVRDSFFCATVPLPDRQMPDEMNQCRGARNIPHCGRHVRACFLSCVAGKAYLALKNMPEWIGRRDRSALRFERCTLQVKGGRQNGRRKWEPAALHECGERLLEVPRHPALREEGGDEEGNGVEKGPEDAAQDGDDVQRGFFLSLIHI